MKKYLCKRLPVLFPVCVEYTAQQLLRCFTSKMVFSFSLGIPVAIVAKKDDTVAVIQKHLRRRASVAIAIFRVLERNPDITNTFPCRTKLPWLGSAFVIQRSSQIPCSVRERCEFSFRHRLTSLQPQC